MGANLIFVYRYPPNYATVTFPKSGGITQHLLPDWSHSAKHMIFLILMLFILAFYEYCFKMSKFAPTPPPHTKQFNQK
jgi:hypothetical protein